MLYGNNLKTRNDFAEFIIIKVIFKLDISRRQLQ